MPDFVKQQGTPVGPFGVREFLRSTHLFLTESYMASSAAQPAISVGGSANQKVLIAGTVMAKITSGPEAGKVGPFQALASGGTSDGRDVPANIVGLALTSLPWTLNERDVEISVVYDASVVQGWCTEYDATGAPKPLSNATAAAMQRGGAAGKSVDITFN